ncbi:nicotinamide-nucleotide amidase [Pectobacterium actinidiae]|uniref:nicotinamide-nucleotide amidase n=1 Tax=Pectobacterium actinidiae TaxID=1507808 RepID=UPI002A81A3B0|nr:nicotinamide-nucleotide amidase [Pectobacterium actinidiae]MDY4316931.1 nicotinamide-nucleotide amidase [Pectobacterium actinidiae]
MTEADILRLSALVGEKLKARGATLTCAESCTGGWLAKSITDIAGSSGWFDYGFVTYSNLAKQRLVNVNAETLERHGAVSEAVVNEMASGALQAADADFSISVSGVAGPDGGTEEKPVGTVWFGFSGKEGGAFTRTMRFSGDRNAVRLQSVHFALQTLLDTFLKK